MRIAFSGSFPKDPAYPESNEDCLLMDSEAGRWAMCDGASESFDSRTWASILAKMFLANPAINAEWISQAVAEYSINFDPRNLSWSKQAAFERGSFSTLLGIEANKERNCFEIIAIGDTLALLIDEGVIIRSWPYSKSQEFEQRPTLLSTQTILNDFVGQGGFYTDRSVVWSLEGLKEPTFLCLTDALGEWVLKMVESQNTMWLRLLNIQTVDELGELVSSQRHENLMRTDDSTLLVIKLDTESSDGLPDA